MYSTTTFNKFYIKFIRRAKRIVKLAWGCGNERKSIVDKDSGRQAVLDGLILFGQVCKTATVRRTTWSCYGNGSLTVKLVTRKY